MNSIVRSQLAGRSPSCSICFLSFADSVIQPPFSSQQVTSCLSLTENEQRGCGWSSASFYGQGRDFEAKTLLFRRSCVQTSISKKSSRLVPRHWGGLKCAGLSKGKPIPQIGSFGAHSASSASLVDNSWSCSAGFCVNFAISAGSSASYRIPAHTLST